MRKIYSLVLMAAMLLVGANAWAGQVRSVGDATTFNTAWTTTAVDGDTIRLTDTISLNSTFMLTDGRELTLDMNGMNIVFTCLTGNNPWPFEMTHGKLHIIGTGQIRNNTTPTGTFVFETKEMRVVYIKGANFLEAPEDYVLLDVGENVFLNCHKGKNAIEVINLANGQKKANGINAAAFGVKVLVAGKCYGQKYGIQLSGNVDVVPSDPFVTGNPHFPYFHIKKTAQVWALPDSEKAVGVYAAGYGIWLIEGYVHGSTGVYVKAGEVVINDAKIKSDNNTDSGVYSSTGSGVNAGGNAIATESNGTYAGNITVTISGTSEITAGEKGYAIQDTVTTATESTLEAVTIQGGTFTGGAEGCINIDVPEGATPPTVEITGGTYTGDIETLIDALPDDGASLIQDIVSQEGGSATVVIGPKQDGDEKVVVGPTASDTINFNWAAVDEHSVVNLKATATTDNLSYILSTTDGTTNVRYLSLKGSKVGGTTYTNTITLKNNHTLKVDQIVLDAYSSIIVEPGSRLLVTGSNGIFADNVNNLILQASESGTALFMMSPDVATNKQPKATVQIYTNACQPNATTWKWQRVSIPLSTFESRTSIYTGPYTSGTSLTTWIEEYSSESQSWVSVPGFWAGMQPFKGYAVTNNTTAGGAIYAVKGNMQGVVDASIEFNQPGWNFFGNSYTAPMHIRTMLSSIYASAPTADGTLWIWDAVNQKYNFENRTKIEEGLGDYPQINPLEAFVIRLNSGSSAIASANYETSVWDYNTMTESEFETAHPASAPHRVAGQKNIVRITISDVNGAMDNMILLEGNEFSADYENGADAYKVMNAGLNIFAVEDEEYAMVATDDILGTMISLTTCEGIDYTLTFSNVRGEVYALRDNQTNTIVLMSEGATYNFTAQSNATLDGRFQVVGRHEMPTAVETVEETVNAPKAIYTVMGQYVGETTDWNNLPAGVYVVDGVKVIK